MLNTLLLINQEDIELPVDGESVEKTLSIIELISSGGAAGQVIIAILFLLLVGAIYIYFERIFAIKAASKVDANFMNQIKDHVSNGKIDSAQILCAQVNSPVSRLIGKGITRIGKPLADINTAIENAGRLEIYGLEKNVSILATFLNQTVVCDFRVQDVMLGGQGAPLVPIGDKLLFSEYDYCINLGGFANISFDEKDARIAYDICPVNIVLNHYVKALGLDFDDEGNIASSGRVNQLLIKRLNALGFYSESHPKSLGLEWVNRNIFPVIDQFQLETKDILRTFIEHVAIQITVKTISKINATLLLTGGGTYNTFLVGRIKALTHSKVVVPSKKIVEFKEALIFGFLGVLKLRNETNCLKSVTGASHNHSSGTIFHP